jgi:hypothetical protein
MKKFILSLLLILATGLAAAPADRLERDLGHGLAYFRLHTLPADLPLATARRGAAILDLRYTRIEPGATAALGAWLKSHSSTATPVFVLLNAETDPAVLGYFTSHDPVAGLVTLGPARSGFVPDITLKISPAAERAAYDALEHGTLVETLLTDPANKPRHDEASIAQERAAAADDAAGPDTDLADSGESATPAPVPAPVIDYTLLRAVHLHRALLALRKL